MIERLMHRAAQIPHAPRVGRKVPEFDRVDIREVFARPYRIIYRIHAGAIQVLSIMHFRQRLPSDLIHRPWDPDA